VLVTDKPIIVAVRALRALGDSEPNSVLRQNDHRAAPGIAGDTPRRGRFYDPYLPNGVELALGIDRAASLEELPTTRRHWFASLPALLLQPRAVIAPIALFVGAMVTPRLILQSPSVFRVDDRIECPHHGLQAVGRSSKGTRVKFSAGKRTVIDGPFPELRELIAGFWMFQVNSKEEAIEWVKRCPDPVPGGGYEIEIRKVCEASD
jgi:hypothetical protein